MLKESRPSSDPKMRGSTALAAPTVPPSHRETGDLTWALFRPEESFFYDQRHGTYGMVWGSTRGNAVIEEEDGAWLQDLVQQIVPK